MGKSRIAIGRDSKRAAAELRTRIVAQFIPSGARVFEIGTGSVRDSLPFGCVFQNRPRPRLFDLETADVVVALDAIDTAEDGESLLATLGTAGCPLIMNYRPRDLSERQEGNSRLGFYDLAILFERYGYRVECTVPLGDGEVILRLAGAPKLAALPPFSVAVISDAPPDSFGHRMLATVLPPQANVQALSFTSLENARPRYDLVVIGTGRGLSPAALTDALFDVAERGDSAIGIFGIQYRELIVRPALGRLVGGLDAWFARNEDDLLLFGRTSRNAVHLGEWMLDACSVGDGAPFATVTATDLQGLAQALGSADVVTYGGGDDAFGAEARSLLSDVFGRAYPPDEAFLVDRDAVARYKTRLRANVEALRARIEALLRKDARAAAA